MISIDMNMPKCCDDCPIFDDSGDYPYCRVLHETRGYTFETLVKRFPNCPLKNMDKEEEKHKALLAQYDAALARLKEIRLLEAILAKMKGETEGEAD